MKLPLLFSLLLSFTCLAFGLTPEEFQRLYETPNKNAETCYKLYEAYSRGDGVGKNDAQARKWILAAHRCGMTSARKEIASLPWRKTPPFKKALPVADPGDETARQKGEELVGLLQKWDGTGNGAGMRSDVKTLPKDQLKTVKKLIAEGADLNVGVFDAQTLGFDSALALACSNSDFGLAKLLIDHGADPSANGNLAIEACFVGGGDMPGQKKRGLTPQEKLSVKAINFLLKSGADVSLWSESGWSIAYAATFSQSPLGLSTLVKGGADPDQRQNPNEYVPAAGHPKRLQYRYIGGWVKDRSRPITCAVDNGFVSLVQELIRLKADLKTPDSNGLTPLGNARQQLKATRERARERNSSNPEFEAKREKIIFLLKAAGAPETPEATGE